MVVENSNLDSKEKVDLKEEQEKNLEKLKKEFEEYLNQEYSDKDNLYKNIEKSEKLVKEFNEKFLKNNLEDLTLEDYCKKERDYFLYWLEYKTNYSSNNQVVLGKSRIYGKIHTGLYFYKEDNNYCFNEKELSEYEANEIFEKKVKPFWKEILRCIKENNIKKISKIKKKYSFFKSNQLIAKFINLVNFNKYLLIYDKEVFRKINSELGISKSNDYFGLLDDLSKFFRDNFKDYIEDYGMVKISNFLWKKYGKNDKTQNKEQSKNENKIDEKMEDIIYLLKNKGQIILYGPPGTGKTYMTKEIIKEFIKSENNVEKDFSELKKENRVEFITFHPSYSYEEFIEGITFDVNNENSEEKYILKDGVFKEFCKLAEKNYRKSKEGDKEIDFEKLIEYSFNDLKEEEKIKIKTKKSEFYIYDYNDRTIYFEKKNKDRSHSLCIKTLKKIFEDKDENVSKYIKGGLEPYYKALINFLNEKLQKIERNSFVYDKEELKPYFLIIDEINRGDISKIFGELITLLEKDKRLGEENEIISKLPYSNEDFGVPPNLYVIGTMNTADKSIANLDVALRRRFGFVEIAPDFEDNSNLIEYLKEKNLYDNPLLKSSIEKIKEINNKIKEEPTLGKDKMIGHSFFFKLENIDNLEKDLRLIWNNEIIPLIEEYTYGNEEEMNKILGLNNEENIKKFFDEKVKENSKNPENESN